MKLIVFDADGTLKRLLKAIEDWLKANRENFRQIQDTCPVCGKSFDNCEYFQSLDND